MRDREFVNRFCAFQILAIEDYRGDMDDFLARSLQEMNAGNEDELEKLSTEFRTGLTNNFKVFGRHAFRKHFENQDNRSVLNASLWDVMSTGLSRYSEHLVEARASALKEEFFKLMIDDEFIKSITYSPNGPDRVKYRFKESRRMFKEVLGA